MSSSEDDDDESIESLTETAQRLQKFLHDIPIEAGVVSRQAAGQMKLMRKEIRKVRPPRAPVKKVVSPQLPRQPMPTVPTPDTSYSTFAGKRKRVKDVMAIFMGR